MIAKLGFVLLFVAFGVLTFMMGVFAPDDARGSLPGLEQMLQSRAETSASAPAGLPARVPPGDKDEP